MSEHENEIMKNIKLLWRRPGQVSILAALIGNPHDIANKVLRNRASWKEAVAIYSLLWSLSVFIYGLILKHHTTGTLSIMEFGVFQFIYLFIATAIIKTAWKTVNGKATYTQTFKLSLYFFGALYVLNSLLFPFDLYLDSNGNRVVVLLAALVAIFWILKAWSAYGTLNQCTQFWKKSVVFVVASILFLISGLVLSVITKYFVNIT